MALRKIFRRGFTAFLIAIVMLSGAIVGAAVKIFDGTGQYIMSDFENHDIAKQRAKQRAENNAQKKAGVALKTFSRSINSELTDDEVSAVTNNIIKVSDVKITPVAFEAEGEAGLMYKATLKATIDTDGIYAWLKRDDKEKVTIIHQNDGLQDAIQKNDALAEDLKEQYTRATSQAEKDKIHKQMNDADRDFLANQKNAEGNRLFYAKNYDGAIRLYSESLELKPNWYWAYNNRGAAYNELGKYELAIQDLNKAIELNPNNSEPYNNRGNSYGQAGQYERAIADYNKAIQLNANDAKLYNNRGEIYRQTNQPTQAIADYNKAIQLNPNFAPAYNNRGLVYTENLNQYARAVADYDKAIQLNPNYAEAYYNRGNAYYYQSRLDLAIADYGKAIQLNPNLYQAYYNRGVCYQAIGEETKAQADFAKVRQLVYSG